MRTTAEQTYQVLVTHAPTTKATGGQPWQATLLGLPFIVEEAVSRDQVIEQIRGRIADLAAHAEIVTLHAPALPIELNGGRDELTAMGWGDHGLFKNDQNALQIFDEIEQERDRNLIGGE